jgi:hypothetical protein
MNDPSAKRSKVSNQASISVAVLRLRVSLSGKGCSVESRGHGDCVR